MHGIRSGTRKKALFRDLPAKEAEIDPGPGANMRFYPPGAALTAVEPNPAAPRLRAEASRRGIHLTVRGHKDEALDLPDESVGAVVATLVMGSVDNARQVVSEIRRILAPGGRFLFLEHVAALTGTPLNRFQALPAKPRQWRFDGCHLNRETHHVLARAGFQRLDLDCFMLAWPAVMVMPHMFGIAFQ